MIVYHIAQYLVNAGVLSAGDVYYSNFPLGDGKDEVSGIVITERTGQKIDSCTYRIFIDIYGKYCNTVLLHQALEKVNQALEGYCGILPDVDKICCKSEELLPVINEYKYSIAACTDSTYEDLGQTGPESYQARWGYEIKYTKKEL